MKIAISIIGLCLSLVACKSAKKADLSHEAFPVQMTEFWCSSTDDVIRNPRPLSADSTKLFQIGQNASDTQFFPYGMWAPDEAHYVYVLYTLEEGIRQFWAYHYTLADKSFSLPILLAYLDEDEDQIAQRETIVSDFNGDKQLDFLSNDLIFYNVIDTLPEDANLDSLSLSVWQNGAFQSLQLSQDSLRSLFHQKVE